MFIRINGVLHYLWRAVDWHGVVLDIKADKTGRPPSVPLSACYVPSRGVGALLLGGLGRSVRIAATAGRIGCRSSTACCATVPAG
jgi:hypothetical protein